MFWKQKKCESSVSAVAKQELEANRDVFVSLKEYDEGKKEISTADVASRLRDLQSSS